MRTNRNGFDYYSSINRIFKGQYERVTDKIMIDIISNAEKELLLACGELSTLSKKHILNAFIKKMENNPDISVKLICGDKVVGVKQSDGTYKNPFLATLKDKFGKKIQEGLIIVYYNCFDVKYQIYNMYLHSIIADGKNATLEYPHGYNSKRGEYCPKLYLENNENFVNILVNNIENYLLTHKLEKLSCDDLDKIKVIEKDKLTFSADKIKRRDIIEYGEAYYKEQVEYREIKNHKVIGL